MPVIDLCSRQAKTLRCSRIESRPEQSLKSIAPHNRLQSCMPHALFIVSVYKLTVRISPSCMEEHDSLNVVRVPSAVAFRHSQCSFVFFEAAWPRVCFELLATGSVFLSKPLFCLRLIFAFFEAAPAITSSHAELRWQAILAESAFCTLQTGSNFEHWSSSA